jgi:hypothetical protein
MFQNPGSLGESKSGGGVRRFAVARDFCLCVIVRLHLGLLFRGHNHNPACGEVKTHRKLQMAQGFVAGYRGSQGVYSRTGIRARMNAKA